MARSSAGIGIFVLIVVGALFSAQPWRDVRAKDTRQITVEAYVLVGSDSKDGVECFPWGLVDTSLEVLPFRQVIVTDHQGTIVGAVDLQVGAFTTHGNGQRTCTIKQTLTVENAPFYSFTVDGKYRRTVSEESLAEMDWLLPVHLT